MIPSAEAHIQELPLTNQPTLTTFTVRRSAVGVGQRIAAVIIAKRPPALEERAFPQGPIKKRFDATAVISAPSAVESQVKHKEAGSSLPISSLLVVVAAFSTMLLGH